jgi:hypothetical protein
MSVPVGQEPRTEPAHLTTQGPANGSIACQRNCSQDRLSLTSSGRAIDTAGSAASLPFPPRPVMVNHYLSRG